MRGILYTRHDGGVSVCYPTQEIFRIMQTGGYWNDRPLGFIEKQILRQIESGIAPEHAVSFARAVAFGGLSEAETWTVIRDRDCARHGYDFQKVHSSELPDRWFRDAWTRARSNSGLPYVDLNAARPIQWSKIVDAYATENKRRLRTYQGKSPAKLRRQAYERAIANARDAEELKRVMPCF